MQIKLDLDITYANGTLMLTSASGRQLVVPKDHVVAKKIQMVTLGELSEIPIRDLCAFFGFRTRKSYYDIRRLVLSNDIPALFPQPRGPKRPRKRTPELEKRIIQLRLATDDNMYDMARTLREEGFDVSARLVAQVLNAYGISKKKFL